MQANTHGSQKSVTTRRPIRCDFTLVFYSTPVSPCRSAVEGSDRGLEGRFRRTSRVTFRRGVVLSSLVAGLLLPTGAKAQSQFSGVYAGTYTGTDEGSLNLVIGAQGRITGVGASASDSTFGTFDLAGEVNTLAESAEFRGTIETVTGPHEVEFRGAFSGGQLSGTWVVFALQESGTFVASRQSDVAAVVDAQVVTALNAITGQRNNFYRRMESIQMGSSGGVNIGNLTFTYRGVTFSTAMLTTGEAGLASLTRALGTAFDAAEFNPGRGRYAFAGEGLGLDVMQAPASRQAADPRDPEDVEDPPDPDLAASADPTDPSRLPTRWGAFFNGNLMFSDRSSTSLQSGFDATTMNLSLGADYRFSDSVVAGIGAGYTRDTTDFNGGSEGMSNAYNGALYAWTTPLENVWANAIIGAGGIDFDIDRRTNNGATAKGKTDGVQLWGGLTGSYDVEIEAATLSPYARLNGSSTWLASYSETGAGIENLTYGSRTIWSLSTVLGLRGDYRFGTEFGVIIPYLRAEWEHEFGDAPGNNIRPVGGSTGLRIATPGLDRNVFNLGGGLNMVLPGAWSAFLDYEGLVGANNFTRHSITVGARKEF